MSAESFYDDEKERAIVELAKLARPLSPLGQTDETVTAELLGRPLPHGHLRNDCRGTVELSQAERIDRMRWWSEADVKRRFLWAEAMYAEIERRKGGVPCPD